GGVDEIATRVGVGVEHREGLALVGRPPEDVGSEAERKDGEIGIGDCRHRRRIADACYSSGPSTQSTAAAPGGIIGWQATVSSTRTCSSAGPADASAVMSAGRSCASAVTVAPNAP